MGIMDWFRRRHSEEPVILPLRATRPADPTFWCVAVDSDDEGCVGISAQGARLPLKFSDLHRIAIRTTDEGPGAEDVFWLLAAGDQECLIPHGTPGETELFERFLKLPGFNSQTMIEAMTSADNAEFECWNRQKC